MDKSQKCFKVSWYFTTYCEFIFTEALHLCKRVFPFRIPGISCSRRCNRNDDQDLIRLDVPGQPLLQSWMVLLNNVSYKPDDNLAPKIKDAQQCKERSKSFDFSERKNTLVIKRFDHVDYLIIPLSKTKRSYLRRNISI